MKQRQWTNLLSQLPASLRKSTSKLKFLKDQQLHLFGRLLLCKTLEAKGYPFQLAIDQYHYGTNGRPYIPKIGLDFNISHSGNMTICAAREQQVVGVDVEMIRPVTLTHFKRVMNKEQWRQIYHDADPVHRFFRFWAIKESVIKADGRGLQLSLSKIMVQSDHVTYENRLWHYAEVQLDPEYCCSVASTETWSDLLTHQVSSDWLIKRYL